MKERPILFSAPMVQAILAGTKTQTRRIFKQPKRKDGAKLLPELLQQMGVGAASPYGQPGDHLWVKETHALIREGEKQRPVYAAGPFLWGNSDPKAGVTWPPPPNSCDAVRVSRWRPSIHMPRWASRITLEVTGVRVERLQGISEADAWAEGIQQCDGLIDEAEIFRVAKESRLMTTDAKATYAALWESINGNGSWKANPWVWVVEFKRAEGLSPIEKARGASTPQPPGETK